MPREAGHRRPWSLALRITLVVSLTIGAAFAISAWLVSRSIGAHFELLDFDELQVVTESLRQALGSAQARDTPEGHRHDLEHAVAGHHGVHYGVFDSAGQPIYTRAPAALLDAARSAEPAPALSRTAMRAWTVGGDTYRGAVLALGGNRAVVAVSTNAHEQYLADLRRGLWTGAVAATLVAVLAAVLAVRWGHAPIRRIGATVQGITSEHLHVRLDPRDAPAELAPLVGSFNAMLDQLQASFERLSHFSADIAHELRTPVTNLMTKTQVALAKDRTDAEYREVLYTGLDELDRLRRMIGDMLFLARAENPTHRLQRDELELGSELRAAFEFFEAWAEEGGIALRIECEPTGPRTILANRGMLQRALGNLLGNALRHTPHGQTITVRIAREREAVRLEVCNPGQTIAPEHLPHLFDRFYRIDPARHREGEGAGLGLAIVKAIAEAHGGVVGVESGAGRTIFWICLPAR